MFALLVVANSRYSGRELINQIARFLASSRRMATFAAFLPLSGGANGINRVRGWVGGAEGSSRRTGGGGSSRF